MVKLCADGAPSFSTNVAYDICHDSMVHFYFLTMILSVINNKIIQTYIIIRIIERSSYSVEDISIFRAFRLHNPENCAQS